jgi:hypothetical protein
MLTALVLLCSMGTTDCRNIAESPDQSELPFMCLKYGQEEGIMEWTRILAYITGSVDQELLLRNEYLARMVKITIGLRRLRR